MTKPIRKIRGVLFDLDGTLIDTAPDMINALNLQLSKHDLPSVEYNSARALVSDGAYALLRHGFGRLLEKFDTQKLRQEYLDIYADNILVHSAVFDGFEKVREVFAKENIVWGIVTNKPAYLTHSLLNKIKGLESSQCLIAADSMPIRKPHASGLLLGASQLNQVPNQCMYIGDSIRDIQAGKNASMFSVAASYGYIKPEDDHTTWGADHAIASLYELSDLFNTESTARFRALTLNAEEWNV